MGGGYFAPSDWDAYKTTKINSAPTVDRLYTSRATTRELSPKGVELRESRDSADHPESNAIIVGLDYSGSMSMVSDKMLRNLGTFMNELLDRKVITDPQVMFMGYSDAQVFDPDCFQLTQFESDIRIAEQLEKMYLAGGGGGNNHESDNLVWYFAAYHTSIDCFEKRGKKGYLFTIGDEQVPDDLTAEEYEHVFGSKPEWTTLSISDLLSDLQRRYEVYHVVIEEGSYARSYRDGVVRAWEKVLPQRVISLSDHTKIAETLVSAIQVAEGADKTAVSNTWSGDTSLVVANAVKDLTSSKKDVGELVRL